MPAFGKTSAANLSSCHKDLQLLFRVVVRTFDCSILCGHRGEKEQQTVFESGKSTVQFPNSKHNTFPATAVDVAPYPIDWNDTGRFYMFAGYVLKTAELLGIEIRHGGDWNMDTRTIDQKFNDLPHFELVNPQ